MNKSVEQISKNEIIFSSKNMLISNSARYTFSLKINSLY